MIYIKSIVDAIANDAELVRMLPLMDDVAIVEYQGDNIDGCQAIANFMTAKGIATSVVHRIVLLGKRTSMTAENESILSRLFPDAKITAEDKVWQKINPATLKMRHTLVFHVGIADGITADMFDNKSGRGKLFVDFVNKTRSAYYACLVEKRQLSLFDYICALRVNLRLKDFVKVTCFKEGPQTDFCKNKQEYIRCCRESLSLRDAFFQCIDEAEHGCEECNQCGNYGQRKRCPFAQRNVAEFYRKGIFVPKDERIAHQWEVMASRQDYRPARIQVADDLKDGLGCNSDMECALDIYACYASQDGDLHCVNQIVDISERGQGIKPVSAVPFIARLAQDGDEDMALELSDAFLNARFGLPKDKVQQEEWIQQGAENGNPRFVLAMAVMHERNAEWSEAYRWRKRLLEVAPELSSIKDLEEIELKMLTDGLTPEEVAVNGQNYLYGHFGKERDLRLAFRCLSYASEKGIASATGRLGEMYLKGLHVSENYEHAVSLLTAAAEKDDLFSIDCLIDMHNSERYDYQDGERWVKVFVAKVEEGIAKGLPLAYRLRGCCHLTGDFYEHSLERAFENIKKAAEMGLPQAQYDLCCMYKAGMGCQRDAYEAHEWLKLSAHNGYCKAEGEYGKEVFKRRLTREHSFKYLKHAYEKGYDEVYWWLAQCYMHGYGTEVNKGIAYPLYKRAATNGEIEAQEWLCEKHFNGDDSLPKDYALCAKWGEKAISQGSKSVRFETAYSYAEIGEKERAKEIYTELANEGNLSAMNNLGCLEVDKKSVEWFLKAAKKGDEVAQYNIARHYRYGIAVEQDVEMALEYYKKSANQGYIASIRELGRIYRDGSCAQKDIEESIGWYEKAIARADEYSMIELAAIYCNDAHGHKDIGKAFHFYKMAAEKGNSVALCRLGALFENGSGVEKDIHKAIYWYRKAANKGNDFAKVCLERLHSNWLDADGNLVNTAGDPEDDLVS